MNSLKKIDLLILDDIGLKPYSLEESRDILEIAESRYGKGAMILSGQLEHGKWYELFPDPTTADAIMDRIIHNSYVLALETKKSMRETVARKKFEELEKEAGLT
jgi:DNA replication protein DnaC